MYQMFMTTFFFRAFSFKLSFFDWAPCWRESSNIGLVQGAICLRAKTLSVPSPSQGVYKGLSIYWHMHTINFFQEDQTRVLPQLQCSPRGELRGQGQDQEVCHLCGGYCACQSRCLLCVLSSTLPVSVSNLRLFELILILGALLSHLTRRSASALSLPA